MWPFKKKKIEEKKVTAFDIIPNLREFSESLKFSDLSDYAIAAAYSAVYTKVSNTRRKLIGEVDRMRQFYMVDVILTQLTEDALVPEISTGEILEVTSPRIDIQKEIDYLEEKFDLDQFVLSILPDFLAYGEYSIETVIEPDKGLVDLLDTVEQPNVVALSKFNSIEGYLVIDDHGRITKREIADFLKFSLQAQRVKIDLYQEFSSGVSGIPKALRDVPRFVRVGRSIIYPVIPKLKELELVEALVPATKLSKLSSGTLIGVQVPPGYEIDKALEAAKKIENIINKKVGVDPKLGELTIENIMSAAGRLKVVPIFGDKGQLNPLNYKTEEPDELLSSITDIRRTILTAVGIPYEIVYGGEDRDTKKGEILRRYGRYLRKLKAIQKSIEEGIRSLVYIHLVNKGISFSANDIKVEFYNKIVDMDSLDRLEYMDITIGLLGNVFDFVSRVDEKFENVMRREEFLRFLNNELNVVGFNDVLDVEKLKAMEEEPIKADELETALTRSEEESIEEPEPEESLEEPLEV